MATDIDRLNMTCPASPANSASMHHSSDVHSANDTSMCSGAIVSDNCQLSTPTSKRQRLSPLEVPDFSAQEACSAQLHRLSDTGSNDVQPFQATPQAQRFRDMYDKPPVSPNDPCFGMDLRKAALLRSLMLATDGPASAHQKPKAQGSALRKGKLEQTQKLMPVPSTDSASMDVDCKSDRSSVSPDTASSSVLMAPAQLLNHPLQRREAQNQHVDSNLFS